jgi:hypothetical protein
VQQHLARAEAAQRDLRRVVGDRRPQPAAGQPLGGGDERGAVGDAQAEDGGGEDS